ncbi:aldo/keto reductase [Noviherbaspirillum saxi]|uniref:Aldo/keto reductase n=1 Tax=Noviherbaspirillum saxi TaxID=2320863 RepID=A0A3A3FNL8_9BURK|nr:aldo/keto reductase [Noviherbaspirillum saxi]RJF96075.1 aldo/keto reductase [Noviherbaspirillum saxi]
MRTTTLPMGEPVPILGQGTWKMGESKRRRSDEIAALQAGIDIGMTLIDTAEMYGDGITEELIGDAIAGRRADIFLISKVLPHHATRRGTVAACEASLRRLKIDCLDLYLLHWRGQVPLADTLEGFDQLARDGKIRHWGVSNFDVADMEELAGVAGDRQPAVNQVLYNLTRRGIEHDLVPWCKQRGIPVMAYSPVEQGMLLASPPVQRIADRHRATPAQVALAWVLRCPGMIAIPKAGLEKHVKENRAALDLVLDREDLDALDQAFPPPRSAQPLEII